MSRLHLALEAGGVLIRRMLDASQNGLYVHDLKAGVHVYINAQYTRLTGYCMEELAAMGSAGFYDLFPPEDRLRLRRYAAALAQAGDGDQLEIEYRFLRRDGTWIWCLSSDTVLERGPDGSVRSTVGTFLDISHRKQTQWSLSLSESQARRHLHEIEVIYDSAPIGLCFLDRDLRYVRINQRLAELNGVPAADHIGRTVREVVPGIADDIEPRLRRVLETGEPAVDIELKGETPAQPGVQRTWVESWLPLKDETGQVTGVNIVAKEVTEERKALDALAESEERHRLVADYTYDWEYWVGPEGELRWMSPSCVRITGYPAAAFLEDPGLLERITHPEDRPLFGEHLQQTSRGREPEQIQYRIQHAAGDVRWVEHICQPIYFAPDGRYAGRRVSIRDETVRRKAQARARTLATVVETSGDFIGVASLTGQAIYLNRAGQALVGLEGESAVTATHIEDYLFPEDLSFVRQTVLPTVMGAGRWRGDFRFRHFQTGEPIDVHWDLVRIDDPATGCPARLATVTRDIRKEKAAEQAWREANRRKDEFLTVLGHELRNPMAPIRNAVEVLHLLKQGADPRTDWALQVLDRQTTHLSRLLDDLLDVSRIVRGKLRLEPRPVALWEVIQQAVDGVGPLIQERHHRLLLQLPADDLLVNGDPVRLAQILLNLLLNAAYYTQEGGEIRLTTESEGAEAIVRIRDNGPGIPPDRLSDLFRPFYQGERAEGASGGGLGLGLTISRRLAEMHGGRLEATSDWPEPGSEFSLFLPRPVRSPQEDTPAPSSDPGPAQSLRVLVVDDNADVAHALALLLEVLGYRVETAATGGQALEVATRFEPRVALVDIGLPDMDGLDLARRLRVRFPDRDRLLLVAVTGYGHEEARQRSLEAGFDEHLAKPVDRRTLQALLEQTLGARAGPGAG